jgi:hypothetical protein
MSATTGRRRTSFNLSPEAEQAVRELAESRGVSMGEVIRRAIGTEKFLSEQRSNGSKILILDPDKSMREVVLL